MQASDSTLLGEGCTAHHTIADTLGWLWDKIAEPVLDALRLTSTPTDMQDWPRIWWVPTGALAYLPLHAAGHHTQTNSAVRRTVLDRAISSYLPTVRSLPSAPGEPTDHGRSPSVLAIAMASTPGLADLPGARAEVQNLKSCLPDVHVLSDSYATHDAVLAALPHHTWAHFACHATSTLGDNTLSRLLMHDHQIRPLSVREISGRHLSGAELAYLSACETTRAPLPLADEAVHITGAFQMAGYTHVIGTLWSIEDGIATTIAKQVYATLTSSRPNASLAPTALHHAVRKIRDAYPASPLLWAAHLHVGP